MYHIFFIHSSVNGHLGCFHVLRIVKSTEMNVGVHVSFQIMVFYRHMPRNGIARLYSSSIFSFLRLHSHFSLSCIGEGNGNPLQRSCLENFRDGGAWWAAVYGVTQSRTRLKRLSSSSSSILFSMVGAPIYIPTNSVVFLFLYSISSIYYL